MYPFTDKLGRDWFASSLSSYAWLLKWLRLMGRL